MGPEKKFLPSHTNQNTKCEFKERISKAIKEKGKVTYKGKTIIITPEFPATTTSQESLDPNANPGYYTQ